MTFCRIRKYVKERLNIATEIEAIMSKNITGKYAKGEVFLKVAKLY